MQADFDQSIENRLDAVNHLQILQPPVTAAIDDDLYHQRTMSETIVLAQPHPSLRRRRHEVSTLIKYYN